MQQNLGSPQGLPPKNNPTAFTDEPFDSAD